MLCESKIESFRLPQVLALPNLHDGNARLLCCGSSSTQRKGTKTRAACLLVAIAIMGCKHDSKKKILKFDRIVSTNFMR
jgi:hypothetical protein